MRPCGLQRTLERKWREVLRWNEEVLTVNRREEKEQVEGQHASTLHRIAGSQCGKLEWEGGLRLQDQTSLCCAGGGWSVSSLTGEDLRPHGQLEPSPFNFFTLIQCLAKFPRPASNLGASCLSLPSR